MGYKIFCRDSNNMSEIEDNSVKMILTGPDQVYTQSKFLSMFKECYRVLREDGVFFLVTGHPIETKVVFYESQNKMEKVVWGKGWYPFYLVSMIQNRTDFELREDIIILKRDMVEFDYVMSDGRTIHFPTDVELVKKMLVSMHEHMFVFTKSLDYEFNILDENEPTSDVWVEPPTAPEYWRIPQLRAILPDDHIHKEDYIPCPFSHDTVAKCIELTTHEGDMVLDPMGGTGTICVVAESMNRDSIMYEIEDYLCEIAELRLKNGV